MSHVEINPFAGFRNWLKHGRFSMSIFMSCKDDILNASGIAEGLDHSKLTMRGLRLSPTDFFYPC